MDEQTTGENDAGIRNSTPVSTIEINPADAATIKRTVSSWFFIAGALLLIVGGATVVFPFIAAMAIEFVVGTGFLLAGAAYAYNAFKNSQPKERLYSYLVAAIYTIGGILLFAAPMVGIEAIALAMGIVLLIESLSKIILSKKLSATNPTVWIIDGIIGVAIAAIVLIFWPEDSIWVVGLLVGVRIMLTGILLITASRKVKDANLDGLLPKVDVVEVS